MTGRVAMGALTFGSQLSRLGQEPFAGVEPGRATGPRDCFAALGLGDRMYEDSVGLLSLTGLEAVIDRAGNSRVVHRSL